MPAHDARGIAMVRTITVLVLLTAAIPAAAQTDDRAAVRQAALDYVTAVYEAKPELIERSVSRELTKHGFMRQKDGSYQRSPMTYLELVEVAKTWNANRKRDLSIKEVTVGEVFDQMATATVRANWGIDFMQLAKIDGQWKILNIVWQSHPPTNKTR
jgi:hypothetical protein